MEFIMIKNGWLKNKLYFHILTDWVNDEDREKLQKFAEKWNVVIVLYLMNDSNMDSFTQFRLTNKSGKNIYAMYYRWLIPYVVDQQIQKILYLDIDSVCVRDISVLLNEKFEEPILAVRDVFDIELAKRLKLNSGHCFCAGFIFMNLTKIRKENDAEKIIQYLYHCQTNHIPLPLTDQDAGNVIFDGRVRFASSLYHYSQTLEFLEHLKEGWQNTIKDAYFVHFQGGWKPWTRVAQYFVAGKIWTEAQSNSEWKDISPTGKRRSLFRYAARAARVNGNYLKWLWYKLQYGLYHFKKEK